MERIPFLGETLARLKLDAGEVQPGPLQPAVARAIVARLNVDHVPGARQPLPGELLALSLLHEAAHLAIVEAARRQPAAAIAAALPTVREAVGARRTDALLGEFAEAFPGVDRPSPARLEDLVLVHLANVNPAASPLRQLVDDRGLPAPSLTAAIQALERHQALVALDGEGSGKGVSLLDLLREPARQSPDSLAGQLRYVRAHWGWLLGSALDELLERLDIAIGVLTEEEHGLHVRFGGLGGGPDGGGGEAPSFVGAEVEAERFSEDREWMPRLVLLARSTYVWLDQLSKRYGREIRTLDAVPDEELAAIGRRGITGLWLIGLWERSRASETIKRWRGNADAVASAYSLDDYRIADDLGGEEALADLRTRAWRHGIRMASDMVPNHMGVDSRWVIDHPERFIALDEPPYPAYRFEGRNLATDPRIEIRIEDHYWDDSDAAVVFERRDTATGERRYLYHGNDGTSFPWNDTAQLDFLKADVRETVIQTILDVARRFPVIRFDAAMVLARKHVERLWYPEPGAGGAIPSRAEHAMSKARFEELMPTEFWRDVVDRVAAEAPDTLLLAEAFWLLEGYFVRTLGMHRVYNSAFMHMIRDEDNAGYRKVIRETIEFDPAILGRYVNFLTNPDEETAIEQFGTGDKYFGAATLLATLPGLPMIGHGQVEGFTEKYGMEFRRARLDEQPNAGLIAHFEAQIVPLLRERRRFAGSADFRLYDVVADGGAPVEDVFAYSNGRGADRSLIVYHNKFGEAAGWIRDSVGYAVKHDDGTKSQRRDSLAEALEIGAPADRWLRFRDRRSGLESVRSVGEIRDRGLFVDLGPYECLVLDGFDVVVSTAETPWAGLAEQLDGHGVPSLDEALADHRLRPVHAIVGRLLVAMSDDEIAARRAELAASIGIDPQAGGRRPRGRRAQARTDASATPPAVHDGAIDPAARAAVRLRPIDRATFATLRLATALRTAGLDPETIEQARVALELAHPRTTPDPVAVAVAWLTDPDARAFLQVHEWDGAEWLVRERWVALVELAEALDRASGAQRTSPAIGRLRPAAETAGDRVDAIVTAVAPQPGGRAGTTATARAKDRPRPDSPSRMRPGR